MINRLRSALVALGLCALPLMAATPPPLGIKGYDPVAYFTLQRATPGSEQFEYTWDEYRWRFANAEHCQLFMVDPVKYAPQFANFCAVALARGEVREANPEFWLISDGKLYLFGKSQGADVFRREHEILQRANGNRWKLGQPQDPAGK